MKRKAALFRELGAPPTGEAYSSNFLSLRMDVTDKASIKEAVKIIREADGRLDILVNK